MLISVCLLCHVVQVLESFKIMDYSLLLGVHNMDQAERERQTEGSQGDSDQKRPMAQQKALYSTAMESIQGGSGPRGVHRHRRHVRFTKGSIIMFFAAETSTPSETIFTGPHRLFFVIFKTFV